MKMLTMEILQWTGVSLGVALGIIANMRLDRKEDEDAVDPQEN
jgi:hypothetical protein